jgi:hypothetical protein
MLKLGTPASTHIERQIFKLSSLHQLPTLVYHSRALPAIGPASAILHQPRSFILFHHRQHCSTMKVLQLAALFGAVVSAAKHRVVRNGESNLAVLFFPCYSL